MVVQLFGILNKILEFVRTNKHVNVYINQMLIYERKQTCACKIIYWRVEHIYEWNACDHYLFT